MHKLETFHICVHWNKLATEIIHIPTIYFYKSQHLTIQKAHHIKIQLGARKTLCS